MKTKSSRDLVLLFTARMLRMFAYGFLSIVIALYLVGVGISDEMVGLLFSLTLAGDAVVSLVLTTYADRIGRRLCLIIGSLLMTLTGCIFVITDNFLWLLTTAILGVISPSGKEIGPFLSIEQSAVTAIVSDKARTRWFAWYHLAGSFTAALGALLGGWLPQILQSRGMQEVESYRVVVIGYAAAGALLTALFSFLSTGVEVAPSEIRLRKRALHRSRRIVIKLSSLFALDAFGGGFIVQSFVAWWLFAKFGVPEGTLGSLFFMTELLSGFSALLAARIADRIGLVRTMVFTHVPSNFLLLLVPLMPTAWSAMILLLFRSAISQMDVPTRQSYTLAVVAPDERSAASGVTSIARSVGASVSPALSGWCMGSPALMGVPFFAAAIVKLVYDMSLFTAFKNHKPPEERQLR